MQGASDSVDKFVPEPSVTLRMAADWLRSSLRRRDSSRTGNEMLVFVNPSGSFPLLGPAEAAASTISQVDDPIELLDPALSLVSALSQFNRIVDDISTVCRSQERKKHTDFLG